MESAQSAVEFDPDACRSCGRDPCLCGGEKCVCNMATCVCGCRERRGEGRRPEVLVDATCEQHDEGGRTRRGDFMVIESSGRPERGSMYRRISVTGCTYDRDGLLRMATGMKRLREPDAEVTGIEEAISVVEGGGWTVLEFRN